MKTITKPLNPRVRGLVGTARTDAGDAAKVLNELKQTFEEFKTAQNEKTALIQGQVDSLQTDKIDRINTEVSSLDNLLRDMQTKMNALKVGGAGDSENEHVKAHKTAFNQFFRKGAKAGLRDLEVKAGLNTQTDSDGGYLVPTEMESTIDRVLGTVSVMRQLATVMPIGTNEYKKIVNIGGTTSGWVGEKESRPETSTPSLVELVFSVMELYAKPSATQAMLEDGIVDIAAWLADEVQTEFAEKEGLAFISGDGNKKPRGILGYDTVANASYAWGKLGFTVSGHASSFVTPTTSVNPTDALTRLYYGLKAGYRGNASWIMSDPTMLTVRNFKDADGANVWAPPSNTAEVATILGKPVYNDDNMPAVGSGAFPIAFGDFKRGYKILDRLGIRILRDPFTNQPYVSFYTTKRVGGGVSNFEAIKLLKIST